MALKAVIRPGKPTLIFGDLVPNGGQSEKWHCTACGNQGYGPGSVGFSAGKYWYNSCRRGHLPCKKGCGKLFNVTSTGKARGHRKPCPRPRTNSSDYYTEVYRRTKEVL